MRSSQELQRRGQGGQLALFKEIKERVHPQIIRLAPNRNSYFKVRGCPQHELPLATHTIRSTFRSLPPCFTVASHRPNMCLALVHS